MEEILGVKGISYANNKQLSQKGMRRSIEANRYESIQSEGQQTIKKHHRLFSKRVV